MLILKLFLFYIAAVCILFPLFVALTRTPENPTISKFHVNMFRIGLVVLFIAILVTCFL